MGGGAVRSHTVIGATDYLASNSIVHCSSYSVVASSATALVCALHRYRVVADTGVEIGLSR